MFLCLNLAEKSLAKVTNNTENQEFSKVIKKITEKMGQTIARRLYDIIRL